MEIIECVKCSFCGQLHEKSSDKYIVINGTITSGDDAVIWQNVPGEVLCKTCFKQFFGKIINGEVYR